MLTRAMAKQLSAASAHECLFVDFLSEEEPKKVFEALKHPGWVDAMQDELNQFSRNKVWTLVPAPYGKTIIGSKWVFRNKRDETGIVIKNKARLVAQGYNQQEGIYYDETFAPIKQSERGILINQEKYVKDLLKKYDINGSSVKTLMVLPNKLGPDLNGKAINEIQYIANSKESHLIVVKRIFRCMSVARRQLVCWSAKKQQSVAMSSTKAKYVATAGCCDNILWMKSQITNYDIIYEKVEFTFDEITFTTNNEVALIYPDHLNSEYFQIISNIISKCCLMEAFTRAPTQYVKYLAEFWYTAKTLEDSKIWVSTPTGSIKGGR
ncbi:retrovirus-related pol polyprotein from transposon TNT 1-94 [Tanacetum coccineum]